MHIPWHIVPFYAFYAFLLVAGVLSVLSMLIEARNKRRNKAQYEANVRLALKRQEDFKRRNISNAAAVSERTGLSRKRLNQLGGVPEDGTEHTHG